MKGREDNRRQGNVQNILDLVLSNNETIIQNHVVVSGVTMKWLHLTST